MTFKPDQLSYEDKILSNFSNEILDIINSYKDLTTSDLQGIIDALVSTIYHTGKINALEEYKNIGK